MITEEQYHQARIAKDSAEQVMHQYHKEADDRAKQRWGRWEIGEAYTDQDLIYSAYTRCKKCSAGMAYPKECPTHRQWTCSAVLKHIGTDNGHDALPFAFYEVKSEQQPSAQGATTRPKQ